MAKPKITLAKIIVTFLTICMGAIFLCGFLWNLPNIDTVKPSMVYDIKMQSVAGLSPENKISVSINEISPDFINAIIAVEDKNFYKHRGLDWTGIIRALYTNIKAGSVVEGGSTITQQTAKNLFLSNERTWTRKIKEVFYTVQLERKYSKDEIITLYCNTIFFGHGAYGVEVAARTFFGKKAAELTLGEAALLAGLPRWPSNYDPYINPEKAKERQIVVLDRMVSENMIDEASREKALNEPLQYKQASFTSGDAPYFIAMVKNYLIEKYGERMVYQGGLQVFTTLDLDMQKAANQAFQAGMQNQDPNLQGALVAVDVGSGQIRALIGGRDYLVSNYNRAFSKRQPGSTFKPFVYSLAIDSGLTEASMFMCEEIEYVLPDGQKYKPTDYGKNPYHWKRFTLKEAMMLSDNSIAVQLNNYLTPQKSAAYTERFGFSKIQPVLSLPLGASEVSPLEIAAAYGCLANQGIYVEPRYILKVVDQNGKVLEEAGRSKTRMVVSPENAYIITDMLKGVLLPGGTGSHLRNFIKVPVAGKTGTTDSRYDAWFVGYTPKLCAAVWVGYDQNKSTYQTGGSIAGPIWGNFLQSASTQVPAGDFIKPAAIEMVNICLDTGMVACEKCSRPLTFAFRTGTAPQSICYHEFTGLFDDLSIDWWMSNPGY